MTRPVVDPRTTGPTEAQIEAVAERWFNLSNQSPYTWKENSGIIKQLWRQAVREHYRTNPDSVMREIARMTTSIAGDS